jgi:ADP-heptose:LPS heptosyltransferase
MVRKKAGLDHPLSALQTYLDALKLLDLRVDETLPGLRLSVEEHHRVAFLKSENPVCIGIGWGARWPTKVVPSHVWDAVLSRLDGGRFGSVRLFGLNSDRAEMAAFAGEAQAKHPSLHMHIECGHPLREVMIRIASCAVFVSSDSGLMHLAAALGIPSFGLFGPTHPALGFAPIGPGARAFHGGTWCSPCHRHGAAPCFRERRFCFDDLNSGEIAAAITNAITREADGSGAHK